MFNQAIILVAKTRKITVIPCTGMYALQTKYLEINAAFNTLFGYFWITVLMPHLKLDLGLIAALKIEILINFIKNLVYIFKIINLIFLKIFKLI